MMYGAPPGFDPAMAAYYGGGGGGGMGGMGMGMDPAAMMMMQQQYAVDPAMYAAAMAGYAQPGATAMEVDGGAAAGGGGGGK